MRRSRHRFPKIFGRLRQSVMRLVVLSLVLNTALPAQLLADDWALRPETHQRQQRFAAYTMLNSEVGVLHARIDQLEERGKEFELGLSMAKANQTEINTAIATVSAENAKLAPILTDIQSICKTAAERSRRAEANNKASTDALKCANHSLCLVNGKLIKIDGNLQLTQDELKQVNCLLKQANCILCKLPDNIRRAKVRAFIFGFIVGLGVGGAITAGGGGGGALASVPVW